MILNGKEVSAQINVQLTTQIARLKTKPSLAVVLVGNNPASQTYVKNKEIACKRVGIHSIVHTLPQTTTQQALNAQILQLAQNPLVNGILLQLPLPSHLDSAQALGIIPAEKDVDGLTTQNMGNLAIGEPMLTACTPTGIITLLKHYNIALEGKHAVIINRSNLVGKPLMHLLLAQNATVTMCHSKTVGITKHTKAADIIITATGTPNFLKPSMIKRGATIIDVSMNKLNGKLCGDCNFATVSKKAGAITPVPGGVGPMTITTLLQNTLKAYKNQQKRK